MQVGYSPVAKKQGNSPVEHVDRLLKNGPSHPLSQRTPLIPAPVHPGMDWPACIRSAEAAGCDLLLKHTLLLIEQVLGVELPAAIKQYSRNDARARNLSGVARQFLLAQPGDNPGYVKAMAYHLAFARHGRDRARLVFERVFVPAKPDWNAVRLPDALYFLYYVVRPVRFILGRLPARAKDER
jgi:hypothetical protein